MPVRNVSTAIIAASANSIRPKPARRNDKRVALLAEARLARELVLAKPEHSIASIARDEARRRARLTRLVALSCPAPDIVTAIVQGKHPAHLTANGLMGTALPLSWAEQRRALGFS